MNVTNRLNSLWGLYVTITYSETGTYTARICGIVLVFFRIGIQFLWKGNTVVVSRDAGTCFGWTGTIVRVNSRYVRVLLTQNLARERVHIEMDFLPSMLRKVTPQRGCK